MMPVKKLAIPSLTAYALPPYRMSVSFQTLALNSVHTCKSLNTKRAGNWLLGNTSFMANVLPLHRISVSFHALAFYSVYACETLNANRAGKLDIANILHHHLFWCVVIIHSHFVM